MPAPDPRQSGRQPDQQTPGPQRQQKKPFPFWYILLGLAILGVIYWAGKSADRVEIPYSEFRRLARDGKIKECVLRPDEISGHLRRKNPDRNEQPIRYTTVDGQKHTVSPEAEPVEFTTTWSHKDDEIYGILSDAEPEIKYREKTDKWLNMLLIWVLPIVGLIILWKILFSRMNAARGIMDFRQSQAKLNMQKEGDVTFQDVAGIEECKEELQEVIEFLRHPKKFTRLGGKIPKGVLLVGEPGTGKTLLARAVAGEAAVPFFNLSGSDFVEMFVGVGAARVRDLFQQANKQAPCIIFIDELDALGKARGAGMMGGHEEREQTLNALLVQMDGFEPTKGIILLGATNRPEMLDPALLRAGRFDRQINVPRPDLKGREEILRLHTENVTMDEDVDLRKVAALTPGFVGADLANLANEAALLAARRDKDSVGFDEFQDSIERVVAGLKRQNMVMNPEEKEIVAHHEAGHALVACLVPGADPVRKVSMIARGAAGLGYTMQMPMEDRYLLRRHELLDRMAVMLGGRSAEEEVFEEISTGAQNDLVKATDLARKMVLEYGMSEEIGPLSFPRQAGGNDQQMPFTRKPWSEETNREIDKAVHNLVQEAHSRARELINENMDALQTIADNLKEKEVLERDELSELLEEFGITLEEPVPEHQREESSNEQEGEKEDEA
ncbi:MAG: ATP-dependent zinc metalloprotease FtsH [Candidatus Brocadiia bacterium]